MKPYLNCILMMRFLCEVYFHFATFVSYFVTHLGELNNFKNEFILRFCTSALMNLLAFSSNDNMPLTCVHLL